MNRYEIEDIGKAVENSVICPFGLERECSTLAETNCVRCVKGWFADHDKQIRDEFIADIKERIVNELKKESYQEWADSERIVCLNDAIKIIKEV